jgi:hypothetical protein
MATVRANEISVFTEDAEVVATTGNVHPDKWLVNVWRDHENGGELHVSVHAPEQVFLSLTCGWWEATDDDTRRDSEAAMILHPEGA